MKILYAVQATGNGHISRAMELLPYLAQYGRVDIFLSGNNSHLPLDAPVKFRSKGMSLHYNCAGGIDYWKILRGYQPLRLRQEIRDLPVEDYDLVINDFEYITAAACARKKIPSINFGHQASFQSAHTPRPPVRSTAGEWILKNYARASNYVGLHFEKYDDFIFTPVIKKDIREAQPTNEGHITVYLPSYCEPQLQAMFEPFRHIHFEIFVGGITQVRQMKQITWLPVHKQLFDRSLVHCSGLITGGGFETPAEAIHLGKKIMSVPIRGQYEQACNAAALQQLGVTRLKTIGHDFDIHFYNWMSTGKVVKRDYSNSIQESLEYLFSRKKLDLVKEAVEMEVV